MKRISRAWIWTIFLCSTLTGCAFAGKSRPQSEPPTVQPGLHLRLPPSLDPERDRCSREIDNALDWVVSRFGEVGFVVRKEELIDRTLVFDDREAAKDDLAAHFGIDRSMIPDTFSGTVDGKTLFLVSRAIYQENYTRLYPDFPWSEEEYGRLIAHELVHRAHSLIALERFGTEDGMGPRWFFEGLAITLAGQFAPPGGEEEPLSWKEIADHAARASSLPGARGASTSGRCPSTKSTESSCWEASPRTSPTSSPGRADHQKRSLWSGLPGWAGTR